MGEKNSRVWTRLAKKQNSHTWSNLFDYTIFNGHSCKIIRSFFISTKWTSITVMSNFSFLNQFSCEMSSYWVLVWRNASLVVSWVYQEGRFCISTGSSFFITFLVLRLFFRLIRNDFYGGESGSLNLQQIKQHLDGLNEEDSSYRSFLEGQIQFCETMGSTLFNWE